MRRSITSAAFSWPWLARNGHALAMWASGGRLSARIRSKLRFLGKPGKALAAKTLALVPRDGSDAGGGF